MRRDDEAAWFNELYLLAPVGYFVLGFDSRILLANLAGAEMLGIARANPGIHRLRAFVAEAFVADFDQFIGRAAWWSNCPTANWQRSNAARNASAASSTAPKRASRRSTPPPIPPSSI